MNSFELGNFIFKLVEGDITELHVDAIINAANTNLILGSGVAGAIRRSGGPSIQEECNLLAPIKTGEAVITGGGDLYAKFVIHTAGPIYSNYSPGEADKLLKNSVLNSLRFLELNSLKSIGFPAISAGVYGFPPRKCAQIMISSVLDFIKAKNNSVFPAYEKIEIVICLYGNEMHSLFEEIFKQLAG